MQLRKLLSTAVLGLAAVVATAPSLRADSFYLTFEAPGVQTSSVTTNVNTFTGATSTTDFNGSSITGTYSGSYAVLGASQYGGAGGTGSYFGVAPGNTATLTLSEGVSYFGMWYSALDSGSYLSLYNDNTLVYTFSPSDLIYYVGTCPGGSYCGNPNSEFAGTSVGQQYVYVNFYDLDGTFNKIVFTADPNGGVFESDNQAVANGLPSPVPEPSTLVLGLSGLAGLAGASRNRLMAALRRTA